MTFPEVQMKLLTELSTQTDSTSLRGLLFGKGQLFEQLMQHLQSHEVEIKALVDLALKRVADLDKTLELARAEFDEFKSRNFADWKRVRACIEHENILTNHRLTWLFSSQAFLLATFAVVFNQWSKKNEISEQAKSLFPLLLLIISIFGGVICIAIFRGLLGATNQLKRLDNWWHLEHDWEIVSGHFNQHDSVRIRSRAELVKNHPPLQGDLRYPLDWATASESIPIYFFATWVAIFFFTVLKRFETIKDTVETYGIEIALGVLAALVVLLAVSMFLMYRRYADKIADLRSALRAQSHPPTSGS